MHQYRFWPLQSTNEILYFLIILISHTTFLFHLDSVTQKSVLQNADVSHFILQPHKCLLKCWKWPPEGTGRTKQWDTVMLHCCAGHFD